MSRKPVKGKNLARQPVQYRNALDNKLTRECDQRARKPRVQNHNFCFYFLKCFL